jgi:hypothetical protein
LLDTLLAAAQLIIVLVWSELFVIFVPMEVAIWLGGPEKEEHPLQ